MKKLFKKSLFFISSLTPVILLASCETVTERNRQEFDFGIAIPPINDLNYVTNKSLDPIIKSLVESFFKPGPSAGSSYGAKLNLPTSSIATYSSSGNYTTASEILDHIDTINSDNASYNLTDWGLTVGTINPGTDGHFSTIENNSGGEVTVTIPLNKGASKWSNGDEVTAQDYIDYVLYVLNANVASPKLIEVLSVNIKNAQSLVSLQQDYVKKFGNLYANPFGQRRFIKNKDGQIVQDLSEKVFQSQNPGDQEYVDKFKKLIQGFGMYTGRIFMEYTNAEIVKLIQKYAVYNPNFNYKSTSFVKLVDGKPVTEKLTHNPFLDPRQVFVGPQLRAKYDFLPKSGYDLRIEFEDYGIKQFSNMFQQVLYPKILLPINRKFVEYTVGGIRNFGTDLSKFIWNGPFDISDLSLGQQGYMILSKRQSYYSSDKTVPSKIKVFFADQPELLSSLFSDGYIAKTRIPSSFQRKFWSNAKTRQYMTKQQGYGTIGIQINLDNVKRGKSPLQDPDLRRALFYSINRVDMLRLYGLDSSFPQTTWTSPDNISTNKGYPLETFFSGKYYYSEDKDANGNFKKFPISSESYPSHLSKAVWFESVPRVDNSYSLDVANFYLNRFKKNHPEIKHVKLTFIYKENNEENAAIGLQDALSRQTNGFIEIDPIRLPDGIYYQRLITGDFDLTMKNFDFFNIGGGEPQSYIRAFFNTDEISPLDSKLIGFVYNPTGSLTYNSWWSSLTKQQQDAIMNRLRISDFFRKKFEELIQRKVKLDENGKPKMHKVALNKEGTKFATDLNGKFIMEPEFVETSDDYNKRINNFFSGNFTIEEKEAGWTQDNVFKFVAIFEEIIREFVPVIPLMEVDTFWLIDRIRAGNDGSFQYAFDVENIKNSFITPEDGKE